MHMQKNKDYEAATEDMAVSVAALESATQVLDEATKYHEDGEVIELHGILVDTFFVKGGGGTISGARGSYPGY